LITNTKKNRNIVLIIDESHVNSHSDLANDLKAQINPKIIINVSATPLTPFKKGSDIMVDDQDVIDSGLIKRSIIFQTEEDINSINNMPGLDQDEKMLELAIQKRDLIVNEYSKEAIKVKPLILIQLPNDSDKYSDKFDELKAKILRYIDKRIKADHSAKEKYQDLIEASNYRAIWLSGEQENLETITSNISQIEYLIFKQAAATG
jgi:type III restriction enzyme